MREVCTGSLQNILCIGKALAGLFLDATLYEIACCRVDRNLTRGKYETRLLR